MDWGKLARRLDRVVGGYKEESTDSNKADDSPAAAGGRFNVQSQPAGSSPVKQVGQNVATLKPQKDASASIGTESLPTQKQAAQAQMKQEKPVMFASASAKVPAVNTNVEAQTAKLMPKEINMPHSNDLGSKTEMKPALKEGPFKVDSIPAIYRTPEGKLVDQAKQSVSQEHKERKRPQRASKGNVEGVKTVSRQVPKANHGEKRLNGRPKAVKNAAPAQVAVAAIPHENAKE